MDATFHVYVEPAFPEIMDKEITVEALVVSITAVAVVAEFLVIGAVNPS